MNVNKIGIILMCLIAQLGWSQKAIIASDLLAKVEKVASELETDKPNYMDPVSVNATVVWSEDKTQLAVVMKAVLLDQWHMYAYVPESEPYIECRLNLELPKDIQPIRDWDEPRAHPYEKGIFIYEEACVFVRYCKVENFSANDTIISGLYYQTCDANKCFPPKTKNIDINLK